jgi:two-component system sensor histidine kinase GlrK
MRLALRLLLTHIAPVSLLLLALVAMTLGLASKTRSIAEVRHQHLNTIDAEEELHRTAWDVEVAARRGHEACVVGESEVEVARRSPWSVRAGARDPR